jgi:hypothetical protein
VPSCFDRGPLFELPHQRSMIHAHSVLYLVWRQGIRLSEYGRLKQPYTSRKIWRGLSPPYRVRVVLHLPMLPDFVLTHGARDRPAHLGLLPCGLRGDRVRLGQRQFLQRILRNAGHGCLQLPQLAQLLGGNRIARRVAGFPSLGN